MQRRRVLAAVGTIMGLAGCETTMTDDETAGWRVEADEIPAGLRADVRASLVQQPTADHPARLRVTFASTAEETQAVRFTEPRPFATKIGRHAETDAKLVLADSKRGERTEGCWRAGYPGGHSASSVITVEPEETFSIEWGVFAHPDNDDCLPAGEYRLTETYRTDDEYEWGFSLVVTDE